MKRAEVKFDEQYLRLRTVECGACWEWLQSYTTSGVPLLPRIGGARGKTVRVKVATDILKLKVPKGYIASNICENRRCVRPKHVRVVSKTEMLKRSRRNTNETLRRAKISATHRAKSEVLSEELAAEIRISSEKLEKLAKRHRISIALVSKIKRGDVWAPISPFGAMFSDLLASNDSSRRRA